MKQKTKCLHSGYTAKNGEPAVMPIVQSTTYRFNSSEQISRLFDMPSQPIYSRFANPTTDAVEKKIAELEGGVGAMCTSSGQAASLLSILNLCSAGDSFVCTSAIYGGTFNLFAITLKKLGINCIFVDQDASEEQIQKAFNPTVKAVFGETLTNPTVAVLDIEKLARIAHKNGVPLIVDNTFPTPILCRPFEYGADIVVHSTSKYMDGHALQVGGVIVDSGNFDYQNGNFPDFTQPDQSYHGIVYTKEFQRAAYIVKARMQLMRDFGCFPSAHSSFLLNLGLETLAIRMAQYSQNGLAVAQLLEKSDKVLSVAYPALKNDKYYSLAQKYLTDGCGGVISLRLKGGRKAAEKFINGLKLASNEVHVADIRTCVLHPASSTHRQLTDQALVAAGIDPSTVRFSAGLEDIDDILQDISQSLDLL